MGWIYQPPTQHYCVPPTTPRGDYSLAGSRWQCDTCGTKWIYLPVAWERDWVQLRWWHRFTRPMKESK